jgi:putative flippase GtrA
MSADTGSRFFPLTALLRRYRPLRFLLAGGLNTLFGYAAFYAAFALTGQPALSVVISNIFAILFNFVTIGGYAFGVRDARRLTRFIVVYGALLIANITGLHLLTSDQISAPLAQAMLIPPLVVLSYLLSRGFVFAGAMLPKVQS